MNRISYILKSSKFIYSIYYYVVSTILRLLGIFVSTDARIILFNSFGGKKYDDSPKAIYEQMLTDHRFDDYILVWALQDPDRNSIPGRAKIVKADSLEYFITALKAQIWITNSSLERGLSFKKKNTFCFNTWHGTPIKLMGVDIKDDNQSFKSHVLVRADAMCAQGQYDIDIFSHAFQIPDTRFCMTGLPRNDVLIKYTEKDINKIKESLGISKDKVVLLYAPTFREYSKGVGNEITFDPPFNPQKWKDKLGEEYVVLFRAHYEVAKHIGVNDCSLFLDVSDYPNLSDLMIVSDALISDYSSVFFDYSIMHKPMYCYAYDYDDYMSNRGMYINLKNELPCSIHYDEDSLIEELSDIRVKEAVLCQRTRIFQQKFVTEYGMASEKCCNYIYKVMNNKSDGGGQS